MEGLSLAIGQSCFLHCAGCYNHFSMDTLIPSENIIAFTKFMKEKRGIKKVTICGGDPLSRPDILELLRELRSLNLVIHLDTTGVPLISDAPLVFLVLAP